MTDGTNLDAQRPVIEFLSRPDGYGLPAARVERIETHCSIVFLVADRAYKLKRAIRYASLDYTSLEKRRLACEAELRLNRRTAPALYLEVRTIGHGPDGVLMFDGVGPVADYVVVMRRFSQTDLLDNLVDRDVLAPAVAVALGTEIARFHAAAEVAAGSGGRAGLRRVIADNARELARVAPMMDGAAVGELQRRTMDALDDVAQLLERRQAVGRVRRVHGDLRLANICLFEGRPTLFDCIEFSDEIGTTDVLFDLAFLLMDLDTRGRRDLANLVFNAYFDEAPETDGLRALPLFLAVRAATRAYALAGGAQRQADPARARLLCAEARLHIAAALDFLTQAAPMLVVVGGHDTACCVQAAAALAPGIPPAPGARIIGAAGGAATWRAASAVLAGGCSVVVGGAFEEGDVRNAMASLPCVPIVPVWVGAGRANGNIWRDMAAVHAVVTGVSDK